MAATTSVKDWSDGYHDIGLGDNGPSIRNLRILLSSAGIDMTAYPATDEDSFDEGLEEALCAYQKMSMDMEEDNPSFGILDDNTLNALLNSASMIGDLSYYDNVADTTPEESPDDNESESNPHFDPFFKNDNSKVFRKSGTKIKIILGQDSIVKTIHDVYMRSVGVEFDTSGNPISETYEFIGRDITESDEERDIKKYGK